MTLAGDYRSEMESIGKLSDRNLEDLLAGRAPGESAHLQDLAEFIRATKAVSHRTPDPVTEKRHLAAIMQAHLTSESRTNRLHKQPRRKKMLSALLASLWMKVAAGAVAASAAVGGMAAAGVLPQPAQDAIAAVVERLGIDMPSSEDEGGDETTASDESEDSEDVQDEIADGGSNGKSVAEDVHTVLSDESLEGRDKGDAVSDAASQNRQDGEKSQRPDIETPAGNVSELGPDNHPSGNPTGFGPNNHPSGNPTGFGPQG